MLVSDALILLSDYIATRTMRGSVIREAAICIIQYIKNQSEDGTDKQAFDDAEERLSPPQLEG